MSNDEFNGADAHQIIREMARLSLLSNRLNPIQIQNLKMFPFVMFEGVKTAEIDFDFTSRKSVEIEEDRDNLDIRYDVKAPAMANFRITYRLDIDESVETPYLEERFVSLKNAISYLLWKDILVEVYFNNTLAFTSKKHGK